MAAPARPSIARPLEADDCLGGLAMGDLAMDGVAASGPQALGLDATALKKLAPVRPGHDAVVLAGGGPRTLDLLRLATVRSDDVTVFAERLDRATERYADRFAVLWRRRPAQPHDLRHASALLVAVGEGEAENALVRAARAEGLPVHVDGRPLVSDFALIDFIERKPASLRA